MLVKFTSNSEDFLFCKLTPPTSIVNSSSTAYEWPCDSVLCTNGVFLIHYWCGHQQTTPALLVEWAISVPSCLLSLWLTIKLTKKTSNIKQSQWKITGITRWYILSIDNQWDGLSAELGQALSTHYCEFSCWWINHVETGTPHTICNSG